MTAQDPHNQPPAASSEPADKSLAVAGVVHDVNQMLAVITGRAGLLLNQTGDPELARHLRAILLAAGDAAVMLRRLDTAAAAEQQAGPDRLTLSEVVEQARQLVWPADEAAFVWQNGIVAELRTAVPDQVLREVLSNLLLNALEVMPAGGCLELSAAVGTGDRLILRVADTGPGLPQGDPEQVFARGVSGSGQKDRGIGLAGCRQLLAGVDGVLTAEPGTSAGAVFVLDLPVVEEAVAGPGDVAEAVPAMSVLVVDDEAVVRDMLHDVLSEWGCQVQACRDGQAALAQYTPGSAAVALIDQNLPGLSGLELANRLRVGDPCLSIVIVTGWQMGDSLEQADPLVVDQTARKPLELSHIRDVLIKGHQLNQARRASVARD